MKRKVIVFISRTFLFVLPVFLFFEVLYRLGFYPIVTNSTMFDVKMTRVQKQHIGKIRILAVGSSLAFYELDSKLIVQHLSPSYYNFASWGLQISDIKKLLPVYVKDHDPQYVIMCSSFNDFIRLQNDTYQNYWDTPGFIRKHFPEFFYFKNYNSIHQLLTRKANANPITLDDQGGASLSDERTNVNPANLNDHSIYPTRYSEGHYRSLDSLCAFLDKQHITLIFLQVPINSHYANTAAVGRIIQTHFDRCNAIVNAHKGIYLNYYDTKTFADSLFVDQYHMNGNGAKILTRLVIRDIKKYIR